MFRLYYRVYIVYNNISIYYLYSYTIYIYIIYNKNIMHKNIIYTHLYKEILEGQKSTKSDYLEVTRRGMGYVEMGWECKPVYIFQFLTHANVLTTYLH